MFCYFRIVIALEVSIGVLGVTVFFFIWCMCRKKKSEMKTKSSDSNLSKVENDPTSENVRILEGVDSMEQLHRRVLASRLELGIEREIEDLTF